jgi:hypothetical protein
LMVFIKENTKIHLYPLLLVPLIFLFSLLSMKLFSY